MERDTISRNRDDSGNGQQGQRSRVRAWGLLIAFSLLIWAIGATGPWIQNNIPMYRQLIQVIEEQDIDSAAYFYTEIEASYDGEAYLRESIEFAGHRDAKFNLVFLSVVAFSLLIIGIGFRFLPND